MAWTSSEGIPVSPLPIWGLLLGGGAGEGASSGPA